MAYAECICPAFQGYGNASDLQVVRKHKCADAPLFKRPYSALRARPRVGLREQTAQSCESRPYFFPLPKELGVANVVEQWAGGRFSFADGECWIRHLICLTSRHHKRARMQPKTNADDLRAS